MGFTYDQIRRAAYVLAPDAAPLMGRYRSLPFPEHWRDSILALCNAGRDINAEQYRTVPTYRMDGVLQALAPDLVVRGRVRVPDSRSSGTEDFWLHAPADLPHPLPNDALQRLLIAWMRDLRPEAEHWRLVASALDELRAHPPEWQETAVDLLGCDRTEGGTASPTAPQFQLATDALARRILTLGPYDTGAGTLRFRAVPRGPRQQGAELMSQPLPHETKGRIWWFSVVINISLHTVPFSAQPRLHVHTGIRRWATHPGANGRLRLPFRRDTSVYLSPTVPWLPGAPTSERFAVARLTWNRERQAYDWRGGGPAGILGSITLNQSFPDPAELLTAPADWIGDGPGIRAAVVYSTHMGNHEVAPGLMSHQRSQIIKWAEQALPEGLRRVADLTRSKLAPHSPANARPTPQGKDAQQAEETRAANARRAALAAAVRTLNADDAPASAPLVEFRLLWQTPSMRNTAIAALIDVLGLQGDGKIPGQATTSEAYDTAKPGSPLEHEWRTDELVLRLRCLPLAGGLGDKLGIDPATRPKHKALNAAIHARRGAIEKFLTGDAADPDIPTLALVEIDRRADFLPDVLNDPKFALRLGCADAGVLTQFVTIPKKDKGYDSVKNAAHRARSGWLDGLRQLGVRVVPEHTLGDQLPADLQYAAVWMVKRRADGPTRLSRHTPVTVLVSAGELGSGHTTVSGWDPKRSEWIPYPKFLLRLIKLAEIPGTEAESSGTAAARVTSRTWRQNMDEQRKETARYLQRMIRSLHRRPTMLLTHAQNSRLHWPWLQDSKVIKDLIRTGHAPAAGLNPELRLVRIRGAAGRETPQWWGIGHPSNVNGLPAGLWTEPTGSASADARIFYSTTEKAQTFRKSAVLADKLAPRPMQAGPRKGQLTIDTDVPAWNPTLVEIAVLGCHPDAARDHDDGGDVPEALALAVHHLRQAPDYTDSLSLPLPLHLAGLAQHYVLPTLAGEEDAIDADDLAGDGREVGRAEDESSDPDPDLADAPGLAQPPELEGQLALIP